MISRWTFLLFLSILKVVTHKFTSPCVKSRGQVTSCELANVASKSSRRVPATTPTNSYQLEFLRQVPATCSSKLFVWTVLGTKSLRSVPSRKLFSADLYSFVLQGQKCVFKKFARALSFHQGTRRLPCLSDQEPTSRPIVGRQREREDGILYLSYTCFQTCVRKKVPRKL